MSKNISWDGLMWFMCRWPGQTSMYADCCVYIKYFSVGHLKWPRHPSWIWRAYLVVPAHVWNNEMGTREPHYGMAPFSKENIPLRRLNVLILNWPYCPRPRQKGRGTGEALSQVRGHSGDEGRLWLDSRAFQGRGINEWAGGERGCPRTSPRFRGGEGDGTFNGSILSSWN